MRRTWIAAPVTILALALMSCEKPAPPDTREADAKAIKETEETWAKAAAAKDAAKFASFYTADASVFISGAPAMQGMDTIAKGLKGAMDDANFSLSFKNVKTEVAKSGDWAYTTGTYESSATDPASKKKVSEKGNYVTCWKKQADGTWKAAADINTAEPAAAPAPPAK